MSQALIYEAEAKYPFHTSMGRDEKAWAKRFIYRAERNDRSLLPIQIDFAYLALDMKKPKQ